MYILDRHTFTYTRLCFSQTRQKALNTHCRLYLLYVTDSGCVALGVSRVVHFTSSGNA